MLYLLHHSDAVSPAIDTRRPLSSRGMAQAQWVADAARGRGVKPDVVWHSGKLRARQTAEALLRVCNPNAEFRMARGLRPDDPVDWILDAVAGDDRDIVLASHMPLLPAVAASLVPGFLVFPLNGLVALERGAGGAWEERWRLQPPA